MVNTPAAQSSTNNEKSAQAQVSTVETENAIARVAEKVTKFETKFGKNPTKEEIVVQFKEDNPDTFKDKSYDEIMDILKNGVKNKEGKYDTSLQNKDLNKRIGDQEKKQKIQQEKTTDNTRKQEEIGKMKEELKKEQPKPTEAKKPETKPASATASKPIETKTEGKSRWTTEDEANRGGSKSYTPETKEPKIEKESKPTKEKGPKTPGQFRKKTGKVMARPFKTLNKVRKTIGRTIMAPTYFLADIGEKKATGGKDLVEGYKKIWTGKKAA